MTGSDYIVRRDLRRRSLFVGVSVIGILAVQQAASMLLGGAVQRAQAAAADSTGALLTYYGLYIAFYCLMLLAAPLICALAFRRTPLPPRQDRRPVGWEQGLLLILFGMAFCVLANYLVNYWLQFAGQFGVKPRENAFEGVPGALPLTLDLITYALIPALVEELVFRGWILGSLRPFGERRALLLSALIFGLMHMNLTQAPFAFMLGLLFGFIFLRTGRLWPGMAVHFLNNAMSVVLEYAFHNLGLTENDALFLQITVFALLALAGALSAILLRRHPACRELVRPLTDRQSSLTAAARSRMMWFDPTVIVGLFLLTLFTVVQELPR